MRGCRARAREKLLCVSIAHGEVGQAEVLGTSSISSFNVSGMID